MVMSKEELIEAINSTLISNEEKAITADALRNLLTDIVENSGEGGQGGGITLFVDFYMDENENVISLLTPEQVAHNKAQIDILTKLHDEGKPFPPIVSQANQTDLQGAEASGIVSYMITIVWSATEEVMEELPKGAIFPLIEIGMFPFMINGDGTLLIM